MPTEAFDIKVENGTVRGTLQVPDDRASSTSLSVVIICRGVVVDSEVSASLIEEMSAAILKTGNATVRFEHRCAHMILEDFDAHRAEHDLEDAMAVVRWLMRRSDVDKSKIGIIGYSLGAIAATGVVQSLPSIARLGLVSAITAHNLAVRFNNGNGSQSMFQPGQIPAAYPASLAGIDSPQDLTRDSRPTLVLHGAADRFVPPAIAFEYVTCLENAGRPVESTLVACADHAFSAEPVREVALAAIADFFGNMIHTAEPALSGTELA